MGNILGQTFSDYVKKQIVKRQSRLGGSYFRDTTIAAYNQKAPYIKLTSAVELSYISSPSTDPVQRSLVQQENARIKAKFESLGIPTADTLGDGLAKNFILFGGASNESGDLKSGFNNGNFYSGAYGWGGLDERGPVPMPGITSVQTKYYNNGALSQATINIKCFSKKQFAVIDILYLRPGFTLLLEFGHSIYSKNDDTISSGFTQINTNACKSVLNGTADQFKIYDQIEGARKSSNGNHEGVYGKISKFNWKFNNDGSYDCTVTIIGLGSIIESLKFNNGQSLSLIDTAEFQGAFFEYLVRKAGEDVAVEAGVEAGTLQSIQYKVNTQIALRDIDNIKSQDIKTKLLSKYAASYLHLAMYNIKWQGSKDLEASLKAEADAIKKELQENFRNGDYRGFGEYKKYNQLMNNAYAKLQELGKITATDYKMGNCDFNEDGSRGQQTIPKSIFTLQGVRADGEEEVESPQIYIKFGLLISLIQEKLLVYNKKNKPFFRFDMVRGSDFVVNGKNQKFENDENYILNVPGQISGNPFICLVPHTNLPAVTDFTNIDLYDGGINQSLYSAGGAIAFKVAGEEYAGRLANILVNVDHILSVLQNNTDSSTGDVSTLNFLKSLLADINRALGGINQIDITVSDNGLVRFIENVPPQYGGILSAAGTPSTINAFGVGSQGSFVRDVSLESELSSNFAAMIAIGSQANGNQLGTNATGFSKYNLGLRDRVIKDKQSYFNQLNDVEPTTLNDLVDDLIIAYIRVYSKLNFSSENISALESANRRYLEFLCGALSNTNQITPPFFLPFNLKLKMDGISGMKLYERFKVSDNILPPSYNQEDVDLIVKEINHTVDTNGWITEIGTLSAPSFTKNVGVLNQKPAKPFPPIPAEYLESAFDQSVFTSMGVTTSTSTGVSQPIDIPPSSKKNRGWVLWDQTSYNLSDQMIKDFNLCNCCLYYSGITNAYARFGILAAWFKESKWKAKYETGYQNTDNSRIREVFASSGNINTLTDAQLDAAKASEQTWFNTAYKNLNGNGDYASNDGYTYRGRGIVQLTGKANYKKVTDGFDTFILKGPSANALYGFQNVDLVANPDKLIGGGNNRLISVAASLQFMLNKAKSKGFDWNDCTSKSQAINAAAVCIAGGTAGTQLANDGVAATINAAKHMKIQGAIIDGASEAEYPSAVWDDNARAAGGTEIGGVIRPGNPQAGAAGAQYGSVPGTWNLSNIGQVKQLS